MMVKVLPKKHCDAFSAGVLGKVKKK